MTKRIGWYIALLVILGLLIYLAVMSGIAMYYSTIEAGHYAQEKLQFTLFALLLAFIPISLVLLMFLGTYRERIPGDVWTDIKRLKLYDYIHESVMTEIRNQHAADAGDDPEARIFTRFSQRLADIYNPVTYLLPTLIFFILSFTYWMTLFFPMGNQNSIFEQWLDLGLPVYFQNAATQGLPTAYAFLGAYLWSLFDLARRFWQSDIKPGAYVQAILRVIAGIILATLIMVIFPTDAASSNTIQIAFVRGLTFFLGIFTLPIIEWLWKRAAKYFQLETDIALNKYNLTQVPGITIFMAERLREESIEDFHSLTTANLVELLTRMRYPTESIVDWVDKALLLRHIEDKKFRDTLRVMMGVVTTTDLLDVWKAFSDPQRAAFVAAFAYEYCDRQPVSEDMLRTIEARFESVMISMLFNPNIQPIRDYLDSIRPRDTHALLHEDYQARSHTEDGDDKTPSHDG